MASWDDVHELALAMPGAHEDSRGGAWKADGGKGARSFAWDRPLRARDIQEHGVEEGPIFGVRVADEGEKAALIASDPDVFFTIPHFDGYNAVLVRLDRISRDRLLEVMTDSWLVVAPKKAAAAYLAASNPVPFA
ncbi:MAG: MmcQ/YjbR family DNA-binding protein [Actinomycetota bacterium]|nr:MmcQ/YjbR family DNA-binding protein [Actinomycetota bacterium]